MSKQTKCKYYFFVNINTYLHVRITNNFIQKILMLCHSGAQSSAFSVNNEYVIFKFF